MLRPEIIDDATASQYYIDIDTATGDDLKTKSSALETWALTKKADHARQQQEYITNVFTDFENFSSEAGLNEFDEEARFQFANRIFVADQTGETPDIQMPIYPSKRDEVTDKLFGKTGLSEIETFNHIRDSLTAKKEAETALRELPGALAKGMFSKVAEGKTLDETDSWFLFQDWKDRHADKLGKLPEGWESAMLDRAVKLQARSETMMRDLAPESKRAFDTLMAFTRPEDANALPEAGRADVENISKEFAKLTPEDRQNIYSTLYYAAEADGAGMGKGFFEKVGEGIARGGVNIYNDAEMTAQDRQARQNISYFQSLLDKPEQQPDRMQTAESIQMQRDMAQRGVEENTQRLSELKALREIRQIADGTIDPIKTEMDGILGSITQGAYDFSQSAAYTGMAMVPYVGVPAVMGALTNSNYLRMLDTYPDMDADAALAISGAIAAPQAFIERFQSRALIGKSPVLNALMKKMTDVRIPIAGRLAIGYGANVAFQTGQEFVQEAMPVAADQIAAAIRSDMPEFDAEKAWGAYKEQMPEIFYSMLWGGLIGTGTSTFREFKRNGQFERSLGELEMVGITGEAAQDIAAEQDLDVANAKFREAWSKRSPEDIQAGIAKRAAQLEAARSKQQNPDLPIRRIEQNPDGTLTHIIEKPDGTVLYRTNDSDAADTAFVNITGMVGRSQLTGTTRGIVESLQFIDQVNQAAGRGEDVQKLLLDDAPRNLLDEYEANPTEQNLNNLFETVRSQGQDINEPAELANFPVLASNQGALVDGVFRSIIKIQDGATGDKVVRDFAQDNLKRAIAEGRITMDWVRENLNQVIPLIESERNTGPALRTETDTDVIESFSDVALAYMTGRIREEQIPEGFRGFLRRMAIIVKDIFRRSYNLKRAIADGKVDSNFETFLADSVGLNQQARVDTASNRVSKDIITDGGQMLMDFSIGSRTNAVSTDTPSIRASNATITGPANYSIGAFHGTPHKVDKFSLDKIGTGEGAQAYGWGLYFAENQGVAEQYRKGLTEKDFILKVRSVFSEFDDVNEQEQALTEIPLSDGQRKLLDVLKREDWWGFDYPHQAVQAALREPENFDPSPELYDALKSFGNSYTVELDVEPEDLLDWDKPISEQSPKVKAALQSVSDNWLWQDAISGKGGEQVGGALYSTLRATFPDAEFSRDGVDASKKASEALLAAGIPGIRYLDGGSRSDGEGTYNYVVFDENLIKITEENGNRIPASQALTSGQLNYSIGSMPEDQRAAEQSGQPSRGGLSVEESFGRPSEEFVENDLKKTYWNINSEGGSISLYKETPWDEDSDSATGESKYSVFYSEALESDSQDEYRFSNPADAKEKIDSILREETQAAEYRKWVESTIDSFRGTFDFKKSKFFTSAEVKPIGWSSKSSSRYFSVNLDIKPELAETFDSKNIGDYEDGTLNLRVRFADHAEKSGPSNDISIETRDYHSQQFSRQDSKTAESQMAAAIADGVLWKKISEIYNDPELDFSRPAPATGATNYSIASVEHFKNDKRFDKLVKDGRVVIGHDIEEFKGMHILLHSPDNAFAGTIKLTDGEEIQGKGGVYYPALFADKNYFWASTEAMVMRSAKHLNEIGKKNDGKILMGLVSAPVEKLFSSSSMAGGVVKFLNALSSDAKGGLSKAKLNSMLVTASKVKVVKPGKGIKKFRDTLKASDGLAGNLAKMDSFLEPTGSIFEVRKMFVESLAEQLSAHLGSNSKASEYVAGILTDAENKHAKNSIKRGKLSKASILQGLGNMLTEPFLRDFQDHGNGKIYAVLEVDGMVDGVASTAHESYPFTLVPRNKKSKVKLHVLNQAVDWQDVVGKETGQYATPQERLNLMPTSGMSSTTLKVLGVRGGSKANPLNYSIASQSEIDRVNKALGGMNRGPDERLKVYQRAKQKFSKVMAWNSDELAAMADTGSDDSQIRRTQILQGLGELDGIMSVLPPEVRGRVGGYTKLAGIAPMDVFKDGVKVSEVSGMNGAIISAWMREGQNIGQAGKQVSLPPGYEATENLSTKRADKAIADFFRDRIKKIDTELEKVLVREYTEAITKAVKQSRPKAGDNGVRKSTLGAETQKFADMVQRATLLDDEATPKRMAEIEAALANPDATAEDISALSEEWSILNTFGDLDNRSSETLAQGLDWLKGQLQMGREAWRIKEQARIDEQRARAAATIEWLGKGTAKKRNATKTTSQLASDLANHYLLSHASFEQFVTAIFPPEIAATWSDRLRKADEASQASEIRDRKGILDAVREGAKAANMSAGDAMLWLKGDQKNAVAYLEDRKVKDERIAIDLAQKIVTGEADRSKLTDADVETLRNELAALPADTQKEYVTIKRVIFRGNDVKLDMSRGKAIQYLLSWNQPDVQIKMRKEGWTDESAADLKALVNDPVSRSVINYLQSLYGKGAGIVNPVYSRMFGMTMPQVKNYAPTRFLNAKDTKDIGLDGSPTATGTTPGFAKSRVTHSAKIAPEDALTVAQGHIAQQAHWVHFAELAREFRAILSNPEVRESIKQTHGESVLKDAELWADQLEQRGGNKARESVFINTILGTVLSGKAVSSLGFNLKTLAMQLDNSIRFGLALDTKQIVSALSNPSTIVEDIQTVWESDAIQNRLQGGATAEARFLFSRYAGKPNFAAKIAEASMTPINWLDSAATSISSAIVYRANLNDAIAAGMPENLAKQTALDAASQAIFRFAQPVSFGQKSIVENNGNVMAKMFFLFMSDARLKTAILADAARGLATGRGNASEHRRRIFTVELMAVLSHVVSSAFRDAFSDDDDEEIWNPGGFAKAILLAPLQGFFFAGTVGELAISKLTGQKTFNSSTQNPLLSSMEQAVRAGNNLEDAFDIDDPDAMLKEWNNIFRSMALSPAMAAPAVLLNMVKPVVGLYQNATTEE
jgi:hypothetical protein